MMKTVTQKNVSTFTLLGILLVNILKSVVVIMSTLILVFVLPKYFLSLPDANDPNSRYIKLLWQYLVVMLTLICLILFQIYTRFMIQSYGLTIGKTIGILLNRMLGR